MASGTIRSRRTESIRLARKRSQIDRLIYGQTLSARIGAFLVQQGADMTQRISEAFSMLDWSLALFMGNIPPPRDPDEDDDDEDEDSDTEPDEPAVIREPEEDD